MLLVNNSENRKGVPQSIYLWGLPLFEKNQITVAMRLEENEVDSIFFNINPTLAHYYIECFKVSNYHLVQLQPSNKGD